MGCFRTSKAKCFCAGFFLALTLLLVVCLVNHRHPLYEATQGDLERIDGIGCVTASRIMTFIQEHPRAKSFDLLVVEGIGEYRLGLISEVYE